MGSDYIRYKCDKRRGRQLDDNINGLRSSVQVSREFLHLIPAHVGARH